MTRDYGDTIGLDFDNTIIDYDLLFHEVSMNFDLIPASCRGKTDIRNHIRKQQNGEVTWQKIQAQIYGKEVMKAPIMTGCYDFLLWCKKKNKNIVIVSHKTIYANQDKSQINLRTVAMQWLAHYFFDHNHMLKKENIYFENTRQGKVERIRRLNCSHFIDDLEETFTTTSFPKQTIPILLSTRSGSGFNGFRAESWKEILQYFRDL